MIFLLYSISSTILKGTGFLCEVPYGEYIVREIKAPDGYILSDKKYPVTISEKGEIVEITAINKPVTVEISKRDVHGNGLEGAEMELVNGSEEVVEKWTSEGKNYVISGLSAGKYVMICHDCNGINRTYLYIYHKEKENKLVKINKKIIVATISAAVIFQVKYKNGKSWIVCGNSQYIGKKLMEKSEKSCNKLN